MSLIENFNFMSYYKTSSFFLGWAKFNESYWRRERQVSGLLLPVWNGNQHCVQEETTNYCQPKCWFNSCDSVGCLKMVTIYYIFCRLGNQSALNFKWGFASPKGTN